MISINMLSKAHTVKGQGVLSAYNEQVSLIQNELGDKFSVTENKITTANIMHYHTINPEFYLSVPFAKRKGVTVGYVHFLPETLENSIKLPKFAKSIFYKYVLSFYKNMDYLVTVNPYFIDRLAYYGVDKSKVTYIPNFVSDEMFYEVDKDKKLQLRDKYNIPKDKFVVLCAGQLQKRKGIFDFISIAKEMPHVQFLWAGNFAFGHLSHSYKEITDIVENPPPNVKFLGLIERENMNDIFNLSDTVFLPSYEELFPMIILEAMNTRTPILLRDLDIYENILFDFYLKRTDNKGFIETIKKLSTDENYYNTAAEMSWKGHEFYSRENVKNMWDKFYTKIVK